MVTTTGGRDATIRHIPGDAALSVCAPVSLKAPKGWRWVALNQVALMESGHTPSRNYPEYWVGDIPWIGVRDAGKNHGAAILETAEHTNAEGIRNSSARLLPPGTVCLSRGGTVGYVVMLGKPMATSQGFANWICGDELSPKFLMYLFLSEIAALRRFATGTTIQTIYYPDLKAFFVCIPSTSEQQRIVAILDEAFAAIATAKANAEKNLQNARQLFGNQLETTFEQRGPGWTEQTIANLCDIKHGYAFEGRYFSDRGDYVLLTPGNFFESGGYRDRADKQKFFIGTIPRDYVLNAGDLLVAMTEQARGLLGSPILVPASNQFLHNQRLGLVTAKPGVAWTNDFFYHVFNTRSVRQAIQHTASGVKVRHTSPTKIGAVKVTFPTSLAEQQRVVIALRGLASETSRLISIYERKLAALDAIKKSLLHRAFAGELTADKTAEMVEAVA